MAIAMVAMLAFGGTYAYFTATATATAGDGVTTATVKLDKDGQVSITASNTLALPGDTITVSASVSNNSDVATVVYAQIVVSDEISLEFSAPAGWTAVSVTGYSNIYKKSLATTDEVSFETTATYDDESQSTNDQAGDRMGVTVTATAKFGSIQATYGGEAISDADAIEAINFFVAD